MNCLFMIISLFPFSHSFFTHSFSQSSAIFYISYIHSSIYFFINLHISNKYPYNFRHNIFACLSMYHILPFLCFKYVLHQAMVNAKQKLNFNHSFGTVELGYAAVEYPTTHIVLRSTHLSWTPKKAVNNLLNMK